MKVSLPEAKQLAKKLGIDLEQVPIHIWRYGLQIETEHLESVSCSMHQVGKVTRDHLLEYGPLYYVLLERMEQRLDEHFKGKKKPRVLLPGTKLPSKCK
ncbi:hypothetical protein A9K97_gp464 [Tokyovirus A1]|uniref:hypothetical protein n=1 Tax=Tokyovirus A1 TaxID=1826170 RepID=UPI0007A97318|nr:hypothetical protein A9K97_gp464 [Tokyovirus A1]BAU79887.1 hypothetical protein [Tokyovirus A1]